MLRSIRYRIAVAALALLSTAHAAELDDRHAQFERILAAYHDVYGFSGAVRVAQGSEPVFEQSVGRADRRFGTPFAADTRNSINSISKTFTAAAVMKLVEQGRLDLDAPVGAYLPGLKSEWKNTVTVHHLLSHTSGLPREAGLPAHDEQTLVEQLDEVDSLSLDFEPGSRHGYSNPGYILLGNVIEAVSGVDYADFVEQEVIRPLGLADTGAYRDSVVVVRQAEPYRMSPLGVVAAQRTKTRGESAGGGLYSTVADLHAWTLALESDRLLGEQARARLFQAHVGEPGGDREAYAWSIKQFGDSTLRFAAGSGYGTKSVLIRDPDNNEFIAIVSNWGNTPILGLLRDLYLSMKGQAVTPPARDLLADPATFEDALGEYEFDASELRAALQTDDGRIRLHAVDGRLFMDEELLARGPDGTLSLTYTDELVVRPAGDGPDGRRLHLEIGGKTLIGVRGGRAAGTR